MPPLSRPHTAPGGTKCRSRADASGTLEARSETLTMAALALLSQEGSGFGRIIAGIPHDPPAIFIYIFLGVSIYLVYRGSRTRA